MAAVLKCAYLLIEMAARVNAGAVEKEARSKTSGL
jgi:hypothetical protein